MSCIPRDPQRRGTPQRLLTVRETAAFFGVSVRTVYRWIEAGELRAHRVGRQWRITPEEIERFLVTRASWQRIHVA